MQISITDDVTVMQVQVPTDPATVTVQVPGVPGPQGPQGIPGSANVLTIGTITTGAPGSSAAATISGVSPNQVLNLTIPQGPAGATGAPGTPNTLTIGTVNTVASTTGGSATITGTSPNQVLNLVLPRGYGVNPAGAAGDVMVKNSATDYDTAWSTPASAATVNALVKRDAAGRAQVVDPAVPADIATKNYADGLRRPLVNTQTVNYTLALSDERKIISMNAATALTLTIPTNATVAFPVGTVIDVIQWGSGAVTVAPAAGVSLDYPDTGLTTRTQGSMIRLIKVVTDTWEVFGDTNNAIATAISSSTSVSTANTLIKRDANGRAQVVDPAVAADIATKNYVDTKLTSRTGTSTIDDSAGATTDTILMLKSPASFTGPFLAASMGGVNYLTIGLASSSNEPVLYNPRTGTTNQAIQLGNVNGAMRILPFNDANVYVQSTLSGLVFSGLNGAQGAGTVEFNYANAKFDGPVQVTGKITNVTNPTAAQDAATKNYVDAQDAVMRRPVMNPQTVSYTLVLTDEQKLVQMNSSSALTLTIPLNSSVAFPVGSIVDVQMLGTGNVTISPAAGVTIASPDALNVMTRQNAIVRLIKTATDTWSLTHISTAAATSLSTANTTMKRDAAGRASVADPAVSTDIATKNYTDTQVGLNGTNFQSGTTYTFVLADATRQVDFSNVAAVNVTIPTNATVAFPVGTVLRIRQFSTGLVTIAGAAGVTLNTPDGRVAPPTTNGQWSIVQVLKRDTDHWTITGDLQTATPTQTYHTANKSYADTKVTNAGGVSNIKVMTQAAYTALGTKDSATLYVIQG